MPSHSSFVTNEHIPSPAHRVLSAKSRVLVSLLVALVFHGVYAGWHWQIKYRSGPGLIYISPEGEIWRRSAARTIATDWLQMSLQVRAASIPVLRHAWQSNLIFTIPTLLPASLVGVLVFAILTRRRGPLDLRDPYCRCRRCGYILAGLEHPRCPECGEAI